MVAAGITGPEPAASQREVDQLRGDIHRIDEQGTRGTTAAVGVVQAQLTTAITDLAKLRAEVDAKFTAHETQHEREKQSQRSERHWLVGTGIAGLVAMSAVIGMLLDIMQHIHR